MREQRRRMHRQAGEETPAPAGTLRKKRRSASAERGQKLEIESGGVSGKGEKQRCSRGQRRNETRMKQQGKQVKMKHWMIIAFYIALYDVVAVNASYFMGLWLRFDLRFSHIPKEYLYAFLKFAPVYTLIVLVVFYLMRLYNSLWRFASFSELNRIFGATVVTTVFQIIGITVFVKRMPISYYLIGMVLQLGLTVAVRFAYRYITLERSRREHAEEAIHKVMVIGAGTAGHLILKELKNSRKLSSKPCCVIDDNSNKWGRFMEGVPIVGGRDVIPEEVERFGIDQIMFAIPAASAQTKREILNICKETGCELKSLPGMYQLMKGEVSVSKMKAVDLEDLLGRDPIQVDLEEIFQSIRGKRILVTGGGGSIGSELCRQIAEHGPEQLILFDIYENNVYEIEQELRRTHGSRLNLVVLIGSVRDSRRIRQIFEEYRPQLVYHAAAHKHVPLMEASPNEAVKNNVLGTYHTAYAAMEYGAERFVLISTDKAVNPTNMMGASKRLCEMIIQGMDAISREGRMDLLPDLQEYGEESGKGTAERDVRGPVIEISSVKNQMRSGTQFVAVRFGNVLGSNGSVVPLFQKQITAGGPVTVTHPEVVRYFMTIPEAVSLVLQAGVYAWGGEIFVLDMGEPVKIDLLARNLIQLSGLTPDVDIAVEYTGLRPGEKLFEERLMVEEGMKPTENEKIHIGKPIPFNLHRFFEQLEELAKASAENSGEIVEKMEAMVATFHPVGKSPTGYEKVPVEQNREAAATGM